MRRVYFHLSNAYMKGLTGVRILEDGKEWRLSGLLYADDLVLRGESEKDARVMI